MIRFTKPASYGGVRTIEATLPHDHSCRLYLEKGKGDTGWRPLREAKRRAATLLLTGQHVDWSQPLYTTGGEKVEPEIIERD